MVRVGHAKKEEKALPENLVKEHYARNLYIGPQQVSEGGACRAELYIVQSPSAFQVHL